MRLAGKVAVITGGSKGIGLATAKQFVQSGAKVVICSRSQNNLDNAVNEIELSQNVLAIQCDIGISSDVDNLFGSIGSSGKHFAFAGHTDVVPIGNNNSWTYPPFSASIVNER